MSDKKKLDETVSLEINGTTEDGSVVHATMTAASLEELTALLKNAGVAGNSRDFNGPAILTTTDEINGVTAQVSTSSNSLRAIMQMLEPEFAATDGIGGEDELEAAMSADLAAQTQMAVIDAESDDDDIVDPVVDKGEAIDATFDANGNLTLAEPEVDEDADYDYRTHEVGTEEYPGKGSLDIVQPNTHYVPARSGDNPIDENAVSYDHREDDAETEEYPGKGSKDIAQTTPRYVPARSGDNALDEEDEKEARAKRFADYLKEIEQVQELSRATVKGYQQKANDDDYSDASEEKLLKRGRGLTHAASKLGWKDARVLASEEEITEATPTPRYIVDRLGYAPFGFIVYDTEMDSKIGDPYNEKSNAQAEADKLNGVETPVDEADIRAAYNRFLEGGDGHGPWGGPENKPAKRFIVQSRVYEPFGYVVYDTEEDDHVSPIITDKREADYEAAVMNGEDPADLHAQDDIESGEGDVSEAFESGKEYPDSEEGAIEAFTDLSIYKTKDIIDVRPDPVVENVWMLTTKSKDGVQTRHVVYLKGVDGSGSADFESEDN